jgi:hypothetical protein
MTRNRKRIYLFGLFGAFIVVIPALILYSSGYRLDRTFRLVKTGGIYIVNDESDVTVKLDRRMVKKAGILEKNIFVRDLTPKTYTITVEKTGHRKWRKRVRVEERKVQICYPLLIPIKLNPQRVPKYLSGLQERGRKRREINEEYVEVTKLLGTRDKPAKRGTRAVAESEYGPGVDKRLNRKVLLLRQQNGIYVRWMGMDEKRPYFIDSSGKQPAFFPRRRILSFEFFPGRHDSMLVLLDNLNLYAVEIDRRFGIHNVYRIVSNCRRFAVKNEFLYYLSRNDIYKIDLEPNSTPAIGEVVHEVFQKLPTDR